MGDMRFYVTDAPLATSLSEVSESYFREGLHAGRGGVRVVLSDGSTESISGSRYLEPGTQIRAGRLAARYKLCISGWCFANTRTGSTIPIRLSHKSIRLVVGNDRGELHERPAAAHLVGVLPDKLCCRLDPSG